MKDEERLIRALNELADIAKRKEAEREEARKLEEEKAERRKRLYKLYYEQAPPVSFTIPKNSSFLKKDGEED